MFILAFVCTQAQSNQTNVSVITIIGDPVQPAASEIINSDINPYAENTNDPPVQGQIADANKTIEPTLENGFHMRFELEASANKQPSNLVNDDRLENVLTGLKPPYTKQTGSMSNTSSGGTAMSTKSGKHTLNMQERAFNAKKKFKAWFPHRKKKYHPHLCARF